MTGALLLAILGTAVAAVPALAIRGTETGRYVQRWISAVGFEAAIGGSVALLVRALRTGPFAWRGFEVDAWRATLALGILAVAAAALVASEHDNRGTAGFLGATAAAVASVFAGDIVSFAAFVIATTAGFAVVAVVCGERDVWRALAWFAVSDATVIAGLTLIGGEGMQVPPPVGGIGAALLAIGAGVRCGLFPGARWSGYLAGADRRAAALSLGAMRAQGFAIAVWIGASRGNAAAALTVGGAVLALYMAHRAVRVSSAGAAHLALGALVLAAIGRGVPTTLHGAALLAPAVFLAGVLLLVGRSRDAGSPSLGASALGAAFPGVALIATAMFERGLDDRPTMLVSAAIAGAFAWLAIAGVGGSVVRSTRDPGIHVGWSLVPLGVVAVFVVLPGWVFTGYAEHVAAALGSARTLGTLPGVVPNDAGVVFALAGAVAFVASITVRRAMAHRVEPVTYGMFAAPPVDRERAIAALASAALSYGWFAALLWVGIRRGFL